MPSSSPFRQSPVLKCSDFLRGIARDSVCACWRRFFYLLNLIFRFSNCIVIHVIQ
jgi:hypothetical protein